jgi:ABC-type sugar transport system ATPase subunit
VADEQTRALSIRASGKNQLVEHLSGGNQQKVVLARTLLTQPKILLLDEPTRGIDVASKAEVHSLIARWAQSGKAVVLVSSELPELLSLSDRILVMRQGAITAQLEPSRTTAEEVLNYAMPV